MRNTIYYLIVCSPMLKLTLFCVTFKAHGTTIADKVISCATAPRTILAIVLCIIDVCVCIARPMLMVLTHDII